VGKRLRPQFAGLWGAVACLVLAGCDGSPSALDPQGPAARHLAELTWILLGFLGVATVGVLAVLALALLRRRGADPAAERQLRTERLLIVGGGIVLPVAIAAVLMVLNVSYVRAVDGWTGRPITAGLANGAEVEIVGHRFWWEIRYPGEGFVTANELHIPVGRPVTISMTSIDVIHSFWVPQLHGKIDLTPGHTTYLTLEADRAGEYRGQCAEFCGVQHALMGFLVIAEEDEEHEAWRARQAEQAQEPETEQAAQGLQVFLEQGCGACHAIAGTDADGRLGPDLTHFGSRRTIGAATVPNTRGHLGGWIVDAQSIKPGNLMPPMRVGSDELLALLDFLEGLE
jgi:cytochrome c oxidase subunit II